jgi:glucose/arabinose dehydrogenase
MTTSAIGEEGLTGEYEDFMTGFIVDNDSVWSGPAGVAVTADRALVVSDDANGTIFRMTARLLDDAAS